MFFRLPRRNPFFKLFALLRGVALLAATFGVCIAFYTAFPVPEARAFEPFDLPDAVLQETPSPDGAWIGVRLYSMNRNGRTGVETFTLRRANERLIRDSDGAVISVPYAGNRGVEIQQVSWRNPRNVILTLRSVNAPIHTPNQGQKLLGKFYGISIWGEATTTP